MKKFLIGGVLYSIGLALVLELFFRFVLPASEWPRGIILNSAVRRFDSENFTTGRFTYGRYCKGRYKWSINNGGWNSIFNYESDAARERPMFAILGDSYIEGFYSDVDRHIDVFLTNLFGDSVSFYTFAMSGGILSQYIALMKYEIEEYSPDGYIVFVNSADVLRSVRQLGGRHRYYFQYSVDSTGSFVEEVPVAESRSVYKDLLLRSAFVRYLRANAQVSLLGAGLADENANRDMVEDSSEIVISNELGSAAEFILSELDSFNRPVLIVADCPKAWIYEGEAEEVYGDVMAIRSSVGQFPNVSLLELGKYYQTDYQQYGRQFSVEGNPHWNSYANEFVAQLLEEKIAEMLQSVTGNDE